MTVEAQTDPTALSEESSRISFIERSLSTYSPSGQEERFASLIFDELKSHGLNPRRDGAGNVICNIGSGGRSLLLCGHMDTVPGEIPFRREGNTFYARGACDAKGALLSMLFAFEDLRKSLTGGAGSVIFAAVTDEERFSAGLNELLKNNVRADYAIFGEPCGVSKVTVGYRGHLQVKVDIKTPEVHASAPWMTTNSVELAFSLYSKLKQVWNYDDRTGQSTETTSVSLTEIRGGSAHNVTPGKTTMTLDVRMPIGTKSSIIRSDVERVAEEFRDSSQNATISLWFDEPTEPYRARLDSDLVRAMNRTLLKSGHQKPSFVSKSGTGDMNAYALAFGVEAVTYGPGDTKLSHTADERIDAEEIFACADVLSKTTLELFAMKSKTQGGE